MAVELHRRGRRRAALFNCDVMADHAMDIMLSLFLADGHERAPSGAALALAHAMARPRCETMLDDLAQAGLVRRAAARDAVELTDRGRRLMRQYVEAALPAGGG